MVILLLVCIDIVIIMIHDEIEWYQENKFNKKCDIHEDD